MNPHLNAKHCLFVLLLLGGDTPQHGFVGYSSIFPLDQPETPPRSPSCRLIAGRFSFQEISSCSSLRPNMSPINLKGLRGQINKLFKNRIPPLKGIKTFCWNCFRNHVQSAGMRIALPSPCGLRRRCPNKASKIWRSE